MAFELIVAGGSWGGMRAIATVLEALPSDYDLPVVVALHRPPGTTDELLEGFTVRFGPVGDTPRRHLLTWADWVIQRRPFEALQLVLPDTAGRGTPSSSTSIPRPTRGAIEGVGPAPLRGGEHCEVQRLRGPGHAGVVGDHGTQVVTDLQRGREVQRVERSQRDGFELRRSGANRLGQLDHGDLRDDGMRLHDQTRYAATHRSDDLDLDDGARQLVAVATQQPAQRTRLRFLDDELDERRGVDVDQSRSSRMS